MAVKKSALSWMIEKWPSSVVARTMVGSFTGGAMTPKYQGNLDASGWGPPRIRIGKKICYPVVEYVAWLESRMSDVKKSPVPEQLRKG